MKTVAVLLVVLALFPAALPALELDYSTFLGGSGYDRAYAVALDGDVAYIAGETKSLDFPTTDAFQAAFSGQTFYKDAFVTRFSADGSSLHYSTYLGGSNNDGGFGSPEYKMGLAVDTAGSAYVAGFTESTDFPVLNAYQASKPGSSGTAAAFVAKLDWNGTLSYSTYLGGSDSDYAAAVAVDWFGQAYVTGRTGSRDFPTLDAFQPAHGGGNDDAFVTCLNPQGNGLVYSTFLGGSGNDDRGYGVAILEAPFASPCVVGTTDSPDFPTVNPYQASSPGGYSDAFVVQFTSSGVTYSTYLGGSAYDIAFAVALDGNGAACVAGSTSSDDFPTRYPVQGALAGNSDACVTKLQWNSGLGRPEVVFSTYLGGMDFDYARGVAVDWAGFVYLAGDTRSGDFPLLYPYQAEFNPGTTVADYDAFLAKLSCSGDFLYYSSYLGGEGADSAYGIAVDDDQVAYLAGGTVSDNFPVAEAYQPFRAGGEDAFLSKLGHTPPRMVIADSDYNGDGTDDIAVFRSRTGLWSVRGVTRVFFGKDGDTPVAGDYDGDSRADVAIFRPSNGLWRIQGLTRHYFAAQDWPVPADYNGDGTDNSAVFRPTDGLWWVRGVTQAYYGRRGDVTVPGDYNGDGTAEIAIFRGQSALWSVRGLTKIYFGRRGDTVVPGNYLGAGIITPALFRPASGLWVVRGQTKVYYGSCSDRAVPADYNGAAGADLGILRNYNGLWSVSGVTRVYFGLPGDIPVVQ